MDPRANKRKTDMYVPAPTLCTVVLVDIARFLRFVDKLHQQASDVRRDTISKNITPKEDN